jgi:hypothetical protein
MKTIRILGLAVAAAAVALLLSMSHASAQPVAGAYYFGSIAGAGDIEFDVSAGGDEVQNLRVTQIPCDGGTHDEFTWPVPIAVVDDQFDASLAPLATRVTGQFPTEGSADGTFLLDLGDCQSPELIWTAITTTPSPTPVGGIAELPDVSESAARSYVALAGLAAAALVALSAGAWYARRRWLS